jgi:hypothetical protein
VAVNLVSEACCSFPIVAFKSTQRKRAAIREDYPPPNSLQRLLTISNVRIIYSHKRAASRNQDVLATHCVIHVFPNQGPDKARQIGVQLLLQYRGDEPSSFDLVPAEGGISLSAEVFGFLLGMLLPKVPFLNLIVLTFVFCSLLLWPQSCRLKAGRLGGPGVDKCGLYRLKRITGLLP